MPDHAALPPTRDEVLTRSVRAVIRAARMLEHACTELTLPQYRLLSLVSRHQRASQLAVRLALSKPTVTAVVDGLVERGFLTRSEVACDRRAVKLSLTPAGEAALAAADQAMTERLSSLLERCSEPETALDGLGQLWDGLEAVVEALIAEGGR